MSPELNKYHKCVLEYVNSLLCVFYIKASETLEGCQSCIAFAHFVFSCTLVYEVMFILFAGNWTYTHTIRRPEINKESPERKMQISIKEYEVI